ncbi:hypothetical protein B0O99DRAFT_637062 [Bisporella sp. PMI_857]|nr:hypothetical protein B0O99DRAFT_637062 [Bisporella sp. PMI_857]
MEGYKYFNDYAINWIKRKAEATFFLCKTGYMGVSITQIGEGDIIVVLLEANVPFIVRKRDDYYALAGERFV